MSVADARPSMWAWAWQRMDDAGKLRNDFRKQCPDYETPLPSDYWAILSEAQVLATLAGAPPDVGFVATAAIEDDLERQRQQDAHLRDALRKHDEGPTADDKDTRGDD